TLDEDDLTLDEDDLTLDEDDLTLDEDDLMLDEDDETVVEEIPLDDDAAPAEEDAGGLEDLEELGGGEKPAAVPAPSRPEARPAPAPAARAGGAAAVLQSMEKERQVLRTEAAELVRQARRLRLLNDLVQAEALLERALDLDPGNEDAASLLSEVRLILGDVPSETTAVARDVFTREKLQRSMAKTEVRQAIERGDLHRSLGEYDLAIQSYKRAIDLIRLLPFDLKLDEELTGARRSLEIAEREKIDQEEQDRRELLKSIEEQKHAERTTNLEILKHQIRELHRKAAVAMESREYERAATLYGQIIELNVHDAVALRKRADALHAAHIQRMDRLLRESVENYEIAVVGVEESSIIYQAIFRYPEKEEWLRLSPKVVTVEEEVARTELAIDKEIRRQLATPLSVGFPEEIPLHEALTELQDLTGVNFFIVSGEGDGTRDAPVRLDQVDNLSLQNVLGLLLEKAGDGMSYIIREGAIYVGPKESLPETKIYHAYEISDLIKARPDFNAPPLALDELAGKEEGGAIFDIESEGAARGGPPTDRDELLRFIGKELTGEEAEPEGINIYGGKLSATVSLQDHLKLATILDRFRKQTGMMVTVESRFLDIQDNFLEEIGVNFGSGSTSNLVNNIPDADGTGTSLAPGYYFLDARQEFDLRAASIGALSSPLGSQVNPFNISADGGGAYQINVIDVERYQLEAILTGVAKQQEIRRLNSPRVTAFNTQTAHTLVVQQAAFIQDLEVNQTGVIPVINPVIGVLNTGSILEVRPTISYDRKYVALEIQPTLAEEIGRDMAILNLSGNFTVVPVQLPILSVTKIKTTVTVPDGGTVLVGGLKREIATKTSIGLPFFRHIPIVNLLFGRRGESSLRSNLFVLINAQITIVHEEEEALFGGGV
ncbi:MAG: tetratricopeptide repeat protein, partial [Planctomycetes bacterium]|nr:tetratricopeptide repeat protein [Planctomycetota bacterium]